MGKVMDLAQTCTSMANDMAGDGVQNGESCSDAQLVHRGNGVDCLLGAACRCQCSAGVPAMMRRVGPRSCQRARGSRRSWGGRGSPPYAKGEQGRALTEAL